MSTSRLLAEIGLSRAQAASAAIPASVQAIQTNGYATPGDGGGALYKRVAGRPAHEGRFQSLDGAWWEIAEKTPTVRMFGATGDGSTDDTAGLQQALGWLSARASTYHAPRLIFDEGEYKASDELALPDASGWTIEASGSVTLTQVTDNKIIFSMMISAARNRFKILGTFRFRWANNQPATNTRAIALAFGCSPEVTDGVYDFILDDMIVSNGFRGISIHPDTDGSGYRFPVWGFVINRITSYRPLTGATIKLYSPNPEVGSPRCAITNFYAQGESATEPRLSLDGFSQVDMNLIEFNLGSGRQLSITNCRQVNINQIRLEQASFSTNYGNVFEFSGSSTQVVIRNLMLQTFTLNVANGAYLVNSDQGLVTIENIDVVDVTTTSGVLYLLGQSAGGYVRYLGDCQLINEGSTFLNNTDSAPYINPADLTSAVFSDSAVAASVAASTIMPNGKDGSIELIGSPCYLVGFVVRITSPLTAGLLHVQACKNGAEIASGQFTAQLSTGLSGVARYHPCWKGFFTPRQSHKFVAGDVLTFTYDTSSDFEPTGGLVRVVALLAQVPR